MIDLVLCRGKKGGVIYDASKFDCKENDYYEYATMLYETEFDETPKFCSHLAFTEKLDASQMERFVGDVSQQLTAPRRGSE